MVDLVVVLTIDCKQTAVKKQMVAKVKCKQVESTTKQSVFVEYSYSLKKKHLSLEGACFRRPQNLSMIDQEKQKIQQICIGSSMICSDIWYKYHE